MFKKIYEKFNNLQRAIEYGFLSLKDHHFDTRKIVRSESEGMKAQFNKLERVISSQQRTIEQLTNALIGKYENGLFVISEDCKLPFVIRNGKKITNEFTTDFHISWSRGEAPTIQIEQVVGTVNELGDE